LEKEYRQQTDKLAVLRAQYASAGKEQQSRLAPGILDLEKRTRLMSEQLDKLVISVRYEEKNLIKK
jgi:hypothetical protein